MGAEGGDRFSSLCLKPWSGRITRDVLHNLVEIIILIITAPSPLFDIHVFRSLEQGAF